MKRNIICFALGFLLCLMFTTLMGCEDEPKYVCPFCYSEIEEELDPYYVYEEVMSSDEYIDEFKAHNTPIMNGDTIGCLYGSIEDMQAGYYVSTNELLDYIEEAYI